MTAPRHAQVRMCSVPADKTFIFFRGGGEEEGGGLRFHQIPLVACLLERSGGNRSGANERWRTVSLLFVCVLQHQNGVVDFQGGS